VTNEHSILQPDKEDRETVPTTAEGDTPGLDASQRESYREGGETDIRSQELADEYEEGALETARDSADERGQQIVGGRLGSASDANVSVTGETGSHA